MKGQSWHSAEARRGGWVTTDLILGLVLLVMIMGSIIGAIALQARAAVQLAQETRARLLLEGELERLRGLPEAELVPSVDERFVPFLGVSPSLEAATFRRTVRVEEDAHAARVTLVAEIPRTSGPCIVSIEGILCIHGGQAR